ETPDRAKVEQPAFELMPVDYIRKHQVLPLRFENKALVLGMVDPTNVFLLDEIRRKTRRDVKQVVITPADINRIVEALTAGTSDVKVDEIIKDMAEDDVQVVKEGKDEVTDLEKLGSESPIIRF